MRARIPGGGGIHRLGQIHAMAWRSPRFSLASQFFCKRIKYAFGGVHSLETFPRTAASGAPEGRGGEVATYLPASRRQSFCGRSGWRVREEKGTPGGPGGANALPIHSQKPACPAL